MPLAGVVTAFCGPIGFLGIAVPHLCRSMLSTSDHRVLAPCCILLGAVVAIPVAWLLKKTFFRGEASAFVMELPEYKMPSARLVAYRVYDRGKAFVMRAGTLIFATTILVWAAGYFPADHARQHQLEAQIESLEAQESSGGIASGEADTLRSEHAAESARLIRRSYLGRAGQVAFQVEFASVAEHLGAGHFSDIEVRNDGGVGRFCGQERGGQEKYAAQNDRFFHGASR